MERALHRWLAMAAILLVLPGTKAFAQAPVTLMLAPIDAAGGTVDKRARKFAELVAAKTKGAVRTNVYPGSRLGAVTEEIEAVSMGSIDMAPESDTFMRIFDKDYNIFGVPFLFCPGRGPQEPLPYGVERKNEGEPERPYPARQRFRVCLHSGPHHPVERLHDHGPP